MEFRRKILNVLNARSNSKMVGMRSLPSRKVFLLKGTTKRISRMNWIVIWAGRIVSYWRSSRPSSEIYEKITMKRIWDITRRSRIESILLIPIN